MWKSDYFSYLNEMQHEFPANRFITMHVSHVFDIGFSDHMLVWARRHHHDPQITTYDFYKKNQVISFIIKNIL